MFFRVNGWRTTPNAASTHTYTEFTTAALNKNDIWIECDLMFSKHISKSNYFGTRIQELKNEKEIETHTHALHIFINAIFGDGGDVCSSRKLISSIPAFGREKECERETTISTLQLLLSKYSCCWHYVEAVRLIMRTACASAIELVVLRIVFNEFRVEN